MGDHMHTVLTVGPLTETQKRALPEVMADFLNYQGVEFDPEPLPDDPDRIRITLGDVNYGIGTLGKGNGAIEELMEANMPYRLTDDGGSFHNGTDVIWHPDFRDLPPLTRQANSEGTVVISETLISKLAALDDAALGKTIRGLVKTDPSEPELVDAYKFVASYLSKVL